MAEENNTPIEPQAPQLSEVEQRAMSEGWVPQEEWAGDPDAWRPAKEFLDRGELFKKIDEQKRELKAVRSTMEELARHHQRVREVEFKRALTILKAQKKEALEAGDHDAVVEIDEEIADTKEKAKEAAAEQERKPAQPAQPNEHFMRWQQRNGWYQSDRAMKAVADEVARDLVNRGEVDPVRILAEVDKEVRKEFPQKFENPNRTKATAVEAPVNKGRPAKDDFHMTDEEKAIMNKFVKQGVLTKEKYIEELKATRAR